MKLTDKIKEKIADILLPLTTVGVIYLAANSDINIANPNYDCRNTSSWSRQEKIAYLEKQLSMYKEPPTANQKTGGIILIWANKKAELERLKSEDYKE